MLKGQLELYCSGLHENCLTLPDHYFAFFLNIYKYQNIYKEFPEIP